ncbi:hypothetical protein AGDE_01498 [Angomonas deanei]|nr:hypothetical protein AGDE_01498 [Angomonas deanei]|eukprot:EPY42425.1 hypothetical protein AGDE_01498 [Angomonas deanei]
MYCFSGILRSKALHTSTPFVEGALQLVKLQLAHKNASQDGNKKACTAIEKEFYREVEAFRPCFTLSASLEVAQKYSKHIYSALCYFGMRDDPLIRQIDPLVGKAKMRTARASKGMFKGVSGPISKAFTEKQDDFSLFEEPEVTVFPDELPNPHK